MTEDLQPGDEVWINAKYTGPGSNGLRYFEASASGRIFDAFDEDIRKSPPSEQSETAELERKVVEAARAWSHWTGPWDGTVFKNLDNAVAAYEEALPAPPSLEEEIRKRLEPLHGDYSESMDDCVRDILALVEKHHG